MNKFKSLSKKGKAEYIAIVALYPLFMLFSALGKSLKLFSTKKRQITASVLSFAMILTMLPVMSLTAFAETASEVYVGSVVMNATNQYAKTDADGKVTLGGDESDFNVKFDSITGTLTLNNATITESSVHDYDSVAIYSKKDLKLVLADGTVNTVTDNNSTSKRYSNGICVNAPLTISGGGTLTATGGATDENSYGIYSYSTMTISGGTLTATGGAADRGSYGIYSFSKMTISGGTVNATGGEAKYYSYGIFSDNSTISDGTVVANSTSTTGTAQAMKKAPDLSAYTPPVPTVTASTNANGSSPVSYNASDIATYKYIKIAPSTYTVVGNGDMCGGDWDATNDSNNMVYDAALEKYVKVFDNIKQGDYEFKITLNNSWTTSWGDSSRPTGGAVAKVTKDGMSVKIIFDPTTGEIDTEIYMPDTAAYPTSWSELQTAINAGGDIKLQQDIVAGSGDAQLNVPSTSTVTIDLNGYKIDRNLTTAVDNGSVFYINRGNLTIADTSTAQNGQVTGGKSTGDCGGVFVYKGTFTMTGGNIVGNTANVGGGVYNSSGTFTMNGGNIVGNKAENGGGVNNYGYNPDFTMNGGSIRDNTASYDGGGVHITYGTFTMSGGSITDNTARYGSGVYNFSGTFTMNGGSITDNTAEDGSGVYISDTFKVSGSAIVKDNKKTDDTTSNVYLPYGKYITVTGALSGEIGVHTESTSYPVIVAKASTNPEYTLTATDVAKLINDVDGYEIVKSGDVAVMKKILGTLTKDNFTYTAPSSLAYDGNGKAATVTANSGVSCGTITIKYYDANGTVVEGPTNVGAYTVKIDVAANDNYNAATDLEVGTFTITAKALTKSDLTVTDLNDEIYTGSAIKPEPTVKYGGVTLVKDTDYTLSYGTNTAIGRGNVTINLKGNYSGSAQYEFDIAYGTATTAMYTVTAPNTNNWYNSSIIVSAVDGYSIGKTATGFANSISLTEETANGSKDMYLKAADGKIYKGTFTYKLDKTAPTDIKIQYNNNGFKSFLNKITFGLFFKETVNVEATASDTLSGVDTIQYYAADSAVADTSTITDWKNSLSFTQNSKKIVYVKVTDNAGNSIILLDQGVVKYSDSTVSPTNATFDKNTEEQKDIDITLNLNDNTLREILRYSDTGHITLEKNIDYTVSGNTVTIKKDYFDIFTSGTVQKLIFVFNPMGVINDVESTAMVDISITDTTHYHSGTHHAREEATCTADGNVEYWSCSCGKYFSNEACTTPITNIILTRLGHDFTEKIVDAAHLKSAATCTSPAVYYYDCSRCDEISTTETFTDGEALGHSFGTEWQKDADNHWHSCTHDGCTEKSDKSAHDWDDGKITKPATTEEKGEKTFTCKLCGATKTEAVDMLPPSMTEKTDKFVQGSNTGLTFKSNAALSDLESVSVDGKVLNERDYDKQSGSTIITLKPAFLETLSVGKHTIEIKSVSGTASAEFTIEAKAADPTKPGDTTSPQTGDNNSMILWVCLLFVSGGVLGALGLTKKRRKQSEK